jgi:hypothetical protein
MLRSALALVSSLQVGARIKDTVDRSLRQVAIIAAAGGVLSAAAVFGLIAVYHGLISIYGFSPFQAAGIIAAALALLGALILALMPLLTRRKKPPPAPNLLGNGGASVGLVDQSLGKMMQQVSPLSLLAIAFVAGLLASRRR